MLREEPVEADSLSVSHNLGQCDAIALVHDGVKQSGLPAAPLHAERAPGEVGLLAGRVQPERLLAGQRPQAISRSGHLARFERQLREWVGLVLRRSPWARREARPQVDLSVESAADDEQGEVGVQERGDTRGRARVANCGPEHGDQRVEFLG